MTDQLLANMASGDGNHDFGGRGPGHDAASKATFAESVRVAPNAQPSEAACLNSIEEGGPAGTTLKARLLDAADGDVVEFKTQTGFGFYAKVADLPADVGRNPGEEGATLAARLGLDKVILIVDTSQHDFLGRLKFGPVNDAIQVQYAYTPETENDPASKTSVHDPVFATAGGVRVTSHLQTDGPMIYIGNELYNADAPASNFFSKYTFTLSALQHIGFVKRIWKRSVNVTVTSDTGGKVQESPDAKTSNSIPRLLAMFLAKAFAKLSGGATATDKFNVNAAWARKRGGDWFQALCCKTLHGHTFNPPIDASFTPTFSTLDYIALSYSLLMGVDTLFFPAATAEGVRRVILITKKKPAAYDRDAVIAARNEGCSARILAPGYRGSFVSVLKFLDDQSAVVATSKADFLAKIDALAPAATGVFIRDILSLALQYAHVSFETEADELRLRMEPLRSWITNGENPPTDSFCQHEETLLTAKKVHDKHWGTAGLPSNFSSSFKNRDEFRSLDEWVKTLATKNITRRLQAIAARVADAAKGLSKKPAANKDVFLFLAYIARVDKESPVRSKLLEKFRELAALAPPLPDGPLKEGINTIVNTVNMYISVPDAGPAIVFDTSGPAALSEVVSAIEAEGRLENDLDVEDEEMQGGGVQFGGWRGESKPSVAGVFPNTHALYPVLAGHIAYTDVPADIVADAQFEVQGDEMVNREQHAGGRSPSDLLPVYAMLEALSTQVGPDLDNSPDLYLYKRLFAFLKLASEKEGLGYALREVLFTMVRTSTGRPVVEKALGSSLPFSMLCSSLSEYLCGDFQGLDEAPGIALLSKPEIMASLQGLYMEALEKGDSLNLDDVSTFKASVAKKFEENVDPEEHAEEPKSETEEEQPPAPPGPPPPETNELLPWYKGQPPPPPGPPPDLQSGTTTPTALQNAGRYRTRRRTMSFLPHDRRRTHHAI